MWSSSTGNFILIQFHDVLDNHMVSSTSRFCLPQRVVEVLVAAGDMNLRYLSGLELFNEEDAGAQRSCEQIADFVSLRSFRIVGQRAGAFLSFLSSVFLCSPNYWLIAGQL